MPANNNIIIVDKEPVVAKKGNVLKTCGASYATVVCVKGLIRGEEWIGMAHVMADESEVDLLTKKFDKLTSIVVIGATEEWFSKPIFDNTVAKFKTDYKEARLQTKFNPTHSDTNKVMDVIMNEKGDCTAKIREASPSLRP